MLNKIIVYSILLCSFFKTLPVNADSDSFIERIYENNDHLKKSLSMLHQRNNKTYHIYRPQRPLLLNNNNLIDITDFSIFYNLETKKTIKNMMPRPWYFRGSPLRLPFRGDKCKCKELTCSCCVGINVTSINFNRRACTHFQYEPEEIRVTMNVTMNRNALYSAHFSALNPPRFCIPILVPYLPPGLMDICIRVYDIYVKDRKLHICMDLETRIDKAPILILHFDCMLMGLDGVNVAKPEEQQLQQTIADVSTPAGPISNDVLEEPVQLDSDLYDVVTEEKIDYNTEGIDILN